MREILFRGKRLEVGPFATEKACEWVYGGYAKDCSGEHIYSTLHSRRMVKVVPATIGQDIGRTDKNGKKIFEGDILKGAWGENVVVYYDASYLAFRVRSQSGTERDMSYYDNGKLEVVGNIHDNPELLNGGPQA